MKPFDTKTEECYAVKTKSGHKIGYVVVEDGDPDPLTVATEHYGSLAHSVEIQEPEKA